MNTQTFPMPHGVTLIYKYMNNIAELGHPGLYEDIIHQLYAQMPFSGVFQNVVLIVWHMHHPELDDLRRRKIACPEDYDVSDDDCDLARGLFSAYHPDYPGKLVVEVALFPDNYHIDKTSPDPIPPSEIEIALRVISHEWGHLVAYLHGYRKNTSINNLSRSFWLNRRPGQGHNEHEDFAEVYGACCGADNFRGAFSDFKAYNPPHDIKTYMKTAYWLGVALSNKNVVKMDFKDSSSVDYVQWAERSFSWLPPFYSDKWRRIDQKWRVGEWSGGQWI